MNAPALLALIAELYGQVAALTEENKRLTAALADTQADRAS